MVKQESDKREPRHVRPSTNQSIHLFVTPSPTHPMPKISDSYHAPSEGDHAPEATARMCVCVMVFDT